MSAKSNAPDKQIKELQDKIRHLEEDVSHLEEIISIIPGHVYWKDKMGGYVDAIMNKRHQQV